MNSYLQEQSFDQYGESDHVSRLNKPTILKIYLSREQIT